MCVLRAFGAIHRVRIPHIHYPNEKELSASSTGKTISAGASQGTPLDTLERIPELAPAPP
jgi:hypothetical protein